MAYVEVSEKFYTNRILGNEANFSNHESPSKIKYRIKTMLEKAPLKQANMREMN